jgi:hypothetical protein
LTSPTHLFPATPLQNKRLEDIAKDPEKEKKKKAA